MTVTYVAAGAVATAASGNVTPALPAGWAENDVFICLIASADNVNSTMPVGWTALNAGTNRGSDLRVTSFYRRAVGGDGDPLVTHAAGGKITAVIVAYRGLLLSGTLTDVVGTPSANAALLIFHATGITTTVDGDLCLDLAGRRAGETASNYTGTPTPTERVDYAGASGQPGVCLADFVLASAGATGERSATSSGSIENVGQLVSFFAESAPPATRRILVVS